MMLPVHIYPVELIIPTTCTKIHVAPISRASLWFASFIHYSDSQWYMNSMGIMRRDAAGTSLSIYVAPYNPIAYKKTVSDRPTKLLYADERDPSSETL
jgi:hypothetical protein